MGNFDIEFLLATKLIRFFESRDFGSIDEIKLVMASWVPILSFKPKSRMNTLMRVLRKLESRGFIGVSGKTWFRIPKTACTLPPLDMKQHDLSI